MLTCHVLYFFRRKCQSAFCARRDLCARARMICVPINCLSIIQHSWADQRWSDRFGQRFLSSIETRFPMVSSVQNLFVQRFWVFRLYWNISRSIADSLPGNYTRPQAAGASSAAHREISDLWTKFGERQVLHNRVTVGSSTFAYRRIVAKLPCQLPTASLWILQRCSLIVVEEPTAPVGSELLCCILIS
jgi:hypothetical protein